MLTAKLHAWKKIDYTTDRTGKRLSAEELERQAASSFVGNVEVKLYAGGRPVVLFRCTVHNGKSERFVSLPGRRINNEWRSVLDLGDGIREAIEKECLSLMRKAEETGRACDSEVEL